MSTEPTWQYYLTDYNEGLGLVYERFVLNDFLSAPRFALPLLPSYGRLPSRQRE